MMIRIMILLMFFSISQAPIFAQVKSIDFGKKSGMVYEDERGGESVSVSRLRKYSGNENKNKIVFKKIALKKMEFNDCNNKEIGESLMKKKVAFKQVGELESDHFVRLINKYQFRQDLGKEIRIECKNTN